MPTKQILTHSRIESFKRCPREHYYKYEIGLRLITDSKALRIGKAFHLAADELRVNGLVAALESIDYSYFCVADRYEHNTVRAMLRAYAERWKDHTLVAEYIESELSFNSNLPNPRGRISNTFTLAGKIDAIVRLNDGRLAILEIKTISVNPNDDKYWRMLLMDPQVSGYFLRAKEYGYDVETIIYDVCRKPSMSPKLATPIEKRKYKKDGTLYASDREFDETSDEWEERLYADMLERPDFYFARHEIPRLQADLDTYSHELWQIAQDIRRAQNDGRWYRIAIRQACENCAYFDICSGIVDLEANPTPDGFYYVDNIHSELGEGYDNGTTKNTAATSETAERETPIGTPDN